jgi:transcriptional regulator
MDQGHDFGILTANGLDGEAPDVVPTHFLLDDAILWLHLAQDNPIFERILDNSAVSFTVIDDYTFIPGNWRAASGANPGDGVPTSYYAAVIFQGTASIIDDDEAKAEILRRQLAHFQPEGNHAPMEVGVKPYGPMLKGIRGLRIDIENVKAKFKNDDHKPEDFADTVATGLRTRNGTHDAGALAQLLRRRAEKPAE